MATACDIRAAGSCARRRRALLAVAASLALLVQVIGPTEAHQLQDERNLIEQDWSEAGIPVTIRIPGRWVSGSAVPYEVLPLPVDPQISGGSVHVKPRLDGAIAVRGHRLPPFNRSLRDWILGPDDVTLGELPRGTHLVRIDVDFTLRFDSRRGQKDESISYSCTIEHEITIYDTAEEAIEPIHSREIGVRLLRDIKLEQRFNPYHLGVRRLFDTVREQDAGTPLEHVGREIAVAGTVFIYKGASLVAEFDVLARPGGGVRTFGSRQHGVPVWTIDVRGEPWRIRFRSDPALALHDFCATQYWSGEIEGPLLSEHVRRWQRTFRSRSASPEPYWSEEFTDALSKAISFRFRRTGELHSVTLSPSRIRAVHEQLGIEKVAIGGVLTFLCDGEVVAEWDVSSRSQTPLAARIAQPDKLLPQRVEGKWSVEFRSDPMIARHDFEADLYWCGTIRGSLFGGFRIGNAEWAECDEGPGR